MTDPYEVHLNTQQLLALRLLSLHPAPMWRPHASSANWYEIVDMILHQPYAVWMTYVHVHAGAEAALHLSEYVYG